MSYILRACPVCSGDLCTDVYNAAVLICLMCSREWIVEAGCLVQPRTKLPTPISLVNRRKARHGAAVAAR